MNLDSAWLQQRLTALTGATPPARWIVAYSGGLDSTVLLHLLACSDIDSSSVVAAHVQHDLHPDAAAWSAHCAAFAAGLGIAMELCRVTVERAGAGGLEAAARDARYAALRALVRPGDCVLSAHHENDQAETLFLNLLRGSGPAGLAGIGEVRTFAGGHLVRPLLCVGNDEIRAYAEQHNLQFLQDPGNDDRRFDRNFLRHDVLPVLEGRWPAAVSQLARSARLAGEASALLRELALLDIAAAGSADRLGIGALQKLNPARVRNLLRTAVSECGLPPPPATRLEQAVSELLPARADAQPIVRWAGAEFRRYRDILYVLPTLDMAPVAPSERLFPDTRVDLGPALGALELVPQVSGGIDPDRAAAGLEIRYREGGEQLRPVGDDCTRPLKKLLQQSGVVPWLRDRLPLLYAGGVLVAVADRWIAAEASHPQGYGVKWCQPSRTT